MRPYIVVSINHSQGEMMALHHHDRNFDVYHRTVLLGIFDVIYINHLGHADLQANNDPRLKRYDGRISRNLPSMERSYKKMLVSRYT